MLTYYFLPQSKVVEFVFCTSPYLSCIECSCSPQTEPPQRFETDLFPAAGLTLAATLSKCLFGMTAISVCLFFDTVECSPSIDLTFASGARRSSCLIYLCWKLRPKPGALRSPFSSSRAPSTTFLAGGSSTEFVGRFRALNSRSRGLLTASLFEFGEPSRPFLASELCSWFEIRQ